MQSRPLYQTLRAERLILILQALDRQLHMSKCEIYSIHTKQTVEHLMPQMWVTHWQLPVHLNIAIATAARESFLHTLGNVLPGLGAHPALSNANSAIKAPEIQKHSLIYLNRNLPPVWDEAAIQKRGADFAISVGQI